MMRFFCGVGVGMTLALLASLSAASAQPVAVIPAALRIDASDVGFAKEACHRRHLSWSRFELAESGSSVNVICESDEIVRAQLKARWVAPGAVR
jgi:hypothetical protein